MPYSPRWRIICFKMFMCESFYLNFVKSAKLYNYVNDLTDLLKQSPNI